MSGAISILAVLADRDRHGPLVPAAHVSISILAVLADRDRRSDGGRAGTAISILAVLADRDENQARGGFLRRYFNPRGPCGPRQTQTVKTPE